MILFYTFDMYRNHGKMERHHDIYWWYDIIWSISIIH